MSTHSFTLEVLKQILREEAGVEEGIDLDGDILDTGFEDLGYESLALLETSGRIERDYGISLDESTLAVSSTPRELIQAVNACLEVAA